MSTGRALDQRVVVITGAGRGMGREHARLFAEEGARLVVNDDGCEADGTGHDPAVATLVADELRAGGADAVVSDHDVATMDGATAAIGVALDTYGRLDAIVNNAGMLRDRMFVNMTEDEWDSTIRGHLRSHFCMTRVAAGHWRDQSKSGEQPRASVVNVSSTSGLRGAVGQSNYGAAKAGIAALTVILAEELARYGVRVNAIVPVARTRMTEAVAGIADMVRAPDDPAAFDTYHPGNVSPAVAWLATESCPLTGRVFLVRGGEVRLFEGWHDDRAAFHDSRWTVGEVGEAMAALGGDPG